MVGKVGKWPMREELPFLGGRRLKQPEVQLEPSSN